MIKLLFMEAFPDENIQYDLIGVVYGRKDRWKDGRVGLVLVMHELKPVLVFGGRKKIGGKEIAWWRRDR